MPAAVLLLSVLALAFANGANANVKGVASLLGSGTASYSTVVRWGTLATAAGCVASLLGTGALMQTFSGRGLVPDEFALQPAFLLSAAAGAALANLLATHLGFPVSTTHMLLGGLIGAGLAAAPSSVNHEKLWSVFVKPLLLAPVVAVSVGAVIYLLLRALKLAPDHRTRTLDALHFLSGGAVCFARGMNDTPKMAALLIGTAGLAAQSSVLLVALCVTVGGLVGARQVAETLAHKITDMNPGQGFAANVTTAALVLLGTFNGLPLSTTHVTVGSLLGIGITTRQAKWATVIPVLLAWIVTLPCAALLAAVLYQVVS